MKVLVYILFLCYVHGLHDDEIGKYDWKKEFVGNADHVEFESSMSVTKYLFVASRLNALACLNSKTGEIVWRKILGEAEGKFVGIKHTKEGLLTVTSSGVARLWESNTGLLKWEAVVGAASNISITSFMMVERNYNVGNLLVAVSDNGVHTMAMLSNNPRGETLTLDVATDKKISIDTTTGNIIVLEAKPTKLSATIVDGANIESSREVVVADGWGGGVAQVIILEMNQLVYLDDGSLYLVDLTLGVTKATLRLDEVGIHEVEKLISINDDEVSSLEGWFVLQYEGGNVVFMEVGDAGIKITWRKTFPNLFDVQFKCLSSETFLFVTTNNGSELKTIAIDAKTGLTDETSMIRFNLNNKGGKVDKIFINMFLKRSTPLGFRLILQCEDGSLALVVNPNREVWRRQESLAEVVGVVMIDLPLSGAGLEFDGGGAERNVVADMFVKRIKAQSQQLVSWVWQTLKEIEAGTLFKHKTRDPLIQIEGLTRDPFSLHKMIVVVTRSGVVFGIDSLTGDIVWRHFIVGLDRSLKWKYDFYVLRTTAHFPHPPLVALLALASNQLAQPVLVTFNPITGDFNERPALKLIKQTMILPTPDVEHLRHLLFLHQDDSLTLFPPTNGGSMTSLKFFFYDVIDGWVVGYAVNNDITIKQTWKLKIPSTHHVISMLGKNMLEKVDSVGRPLADRSVIFKYLNPNLVAMVAGSLDDTVDRANLLLIVFDGVTGKVVYTNTHKKASGPVHIVHSENWIIYSYWNTKARRTELTSIELYEGKSQHNKTTFSSFHLQANPMVMQQSYIFPTGISCMGVSHTDKAITARQILFGLKRGALFGLPRRFFDPRRPLVLEESHREEGLIQYMPEIPIPPELFVSYNLSVEKINGIYSSPAALESTSLVFVTGIDIFFTRIQPSKMFDVLKEDFDHMFISIVLIGMFVAALVARRMSQIKQLKKSWR